MDIAHSGYKDEKYGCNHLWVQHPESFVHATETKTQRFHDDRIEKADAMYKGRIDTCKKQGSLIGINICSPHALSTNPINEKRCERAKEKALRNVKLEFGSQIEIWELYEGVR
jgi:hypothetical protein